MNELTDEDSLLEKAVLENENLDSDTKLKIIRKIEETRNRSPITINEQQVIPLYRGEPIDPTKITCKTTVNAYENS